MIPAFQPAICRLPDQSPADFSGWSDEQDRMRATLRGMLVDAISVLRRGDDMIRGRREGGVSGIETVVTTAAIELRLAVEAERNGKVEATLDIRPVVGRTGQLSFPVARLDPAKLHDDHLPGLLLAVSEAGFEQVEEADLILDDLRLRQAERVLMTHLARLRHAQSHSEKAILDAILRFPDGAPADHVSTAELFGPKDAQRFWVTADGAPVCSSPGRARMASLFEGVNDGRAHVRCDIHSPRMDVDEADMPDDPIELARLIRDPSVPTLVEAWP